MGVFFLDAIGCPPFSPYLAIARLASIWPLNAPPETPFDAGIRRYWHDLSVSPTALLGLFLACVQVVQKKHPMKCAGVAGRRVRTPGDARRWTSCALPSAPLPLNRFYGPLTRSAQQLLALVACVGADAATRAQDLAHAAPHFVTAGRGGGEGAAHFGMHAGWLPETACAHPRVSKCGPLADYLECRPNALGALLIGQQSTD